jgi:hypothetical protein
VHDSVCFCQDEISPHDGTRVPPVAIAHGRQLTAHKSIQSHTHTRKHHVPRQHVPTHLALATRAKSQLCRGRRAKPGIFQKEQRGAVSVLETAHHNTYPTNSLSLGPGISFVSKSAMFVSPFSQATRMNPAACASLARWYAIALCRFFNTDSGAVVFLTTDWLSVMIPALNVPYGHVRKSNKHMSTELLIHIWHERYHSWQKLVSESGLQTYIAYRRDYRIGHC